MLNILEINKVKKSIVVRIIIVWVELMFVILLMSVCMVIGIVSVIKLMVIL